MSEDELDDFLSMDPESVRAFYESHVMYYRRDGTPMTREEMIAENPLGKDNHVADNILPNGVRVSTVYLCINHQHFPGPPLIFETMVFAPFSFRTLDMYRYSTEEQAKAGHGRILAEWADRVTLWSVLWFRVRFLFRLLTGRS